MDLSTGKILKAFMNFTFDIILSLELEINKVKVVVY